MTTHVTMAGTACFSPGFLGMVTLAMISEMAKGTVARQRSYVGDPEPECKPNDGDATNERKRFKPEPDEDYVTTRGTDDHLTGGTKKLDGVAADITPFHLPGTDDHLLPGKKKRMPSVDHTGTSAQKLRRTSPGAAIMIGLGLTIDGVDELVPA